MVSDRSERLHRNSGNMITNTKYEPIQKQENENARRSRTASVFPQLHRSTGFSIFLAYAPVLICFLAVGILLWHFERRTERDLESIRSSLYIIATGAEKIGIKVGELQRLVVESSVSKTILENRLDKLSAQISALHSDLSSSPAGYLSGIPREMTLSPEQSSFYHEVEAGDTLNKVSRKYGVPVDQLLATNNLADKDRIYPGQRISISLGAQRKASGSKE